MLLKRSGVTPHLHERRAIIKPPPSLYKSAEGIKSNLKRKIRNQKIKFQRNKIKIAD